MSNFSSELLSLIRSSDRVVIATHVSPDPDAIGSSGALCYALKSIGKNVLLYLPEEFPERLLGFFPDELATASLPEEGYLLIGLDCATRKRLGDKSEELCRAAKAVINIDHHASNEKWGTINHILPDEAATAAMVYDLLSELKVTITPQIAASLYAGIMDDTGSFRFSNTSKKVLMTAAELLGYGAKPSEIANAIYFQEPLRAIKLKGKAIDTISLIEDGSVALAYLSLEMKGEDKYTSGDSEGIIDVVRAIKDIKVAIFLREKEKHHWRGSIRSKSGDIDVSAFAERFGGGGHKAAAGFSVDGTQEEILRTVSTQLSEFIKST